MQHAYLAPTLNACFALLHRLTLMACAAATLFTADHGYLGEDPSLLAWNRCSVLERVAAGPRTTHLIQLGTDSVASVAQARLAGEVPLRETVRITAHTLSSAEVFDRANGHMIAPELRVKVPSSENARIDGDARAGATRS